MNIKRTAIRLIALTALAAVALTTGLLHLSTASAEPAFDGSRHADAVGAVVAGFGSTQPLGAHFPPEYQGDTISIAVLAESMLGDAGRGLFSIRHTDPEGGLKADLRGEINCVRLEGDFAVMTGVVKQADTPALPNDELHVGTVAAIVVQDRGNEGDAMVWAFDDVGSSCNDIPALPGVALKEGNFVISQ